VNKEYLGGVIRASLSQVTTAPNSETKHSLPCGKHHLRIPLVLVSSRLVSSRLTCLSATRDKQTRGFRHKATRSGAGGFIYSPIGGRRIALRFRRFRVTDLD